MSTGGKNPIPADFKSALAVFPGALQLFGRMSPSHRREYLKWIASAKRGNTRTQRVAKAARMIAGGLPQQRHPLLGRKRPW